jgi:Lipopolysaccharide kinase (Kdo/WaaP) family
LNATLRRMRIVQSSAGRSGRKRLMGNRRRNREIRVNGWEIEPIGRWSAAQLGTLEEAVKRVVRAIDGADGRLYYRSRYAVTYLTEITDGAGNALELYVKAYDPPRGLVALKQLMRGGRAGNVLRMTRALQRAGFDAPPLLLKGVHAATGRTMLTTARAEGVPLPELIACARGHATLARKRALLRALGGEIARLHRAGFVHGDLTPYNIFVVQSDPPRFIFLDNDRTRSGFPAGRRYRQLRNFVQLGRFDLPGLSNTDRLRVVNAYVGGLGRANGRAMARRVARMLAKRRTRDATKDGGA